MGLDLIAVTPDGSFGMAFLGLQDKPKCRS